MLGVASESKLIGVHPDLVKVVRLAYDLLQARGTGVGMVVMEGVRTAERQRKLVAAGASKTMDSRHLTGHAVDLGATVDGDVRWDWSLYYILGDVVREASVKLDIPIVWGGVWDRRIDDLTEAGGTQDDVEAYVARQKSMGRKAFLDGPHFQLDKARYP